MHVVWRLDAGRDDTHLVACEDELLLNGSPVLHCVTSGSSLSTI